MLRSLLLSAALATVLPAQGIFTPSATLAASNAATRTANVAPGSYVAIYLSPQSYLPLPKGTLTLTTSDRKVLTLTSVIPPTAKDLVNPNELWLPIPADAALGPATITLTSDQPRQQAPIQIVSTAPSIFTTSYTGYGPALALNYPSTVNALTSAAVPGGIVSLFATGLSGARTGDVTVELGAQRVTPMYAGPQGQPGLDQINFVIPQDALLGCYVSLAIRVRRILSNQSSISVNKDPFACAHPLGISYSDLKTLDGGGKIPLAQLSISSDSSPAAWSENATLFFPNADAINVALRSGVNAGDSQLFACYSGDALTGAFGGPTTNPDAGAITLFGPKGEQLPLKRTGSYSADAPEPTPFFTAGTWRVSATGGVDLGSFQSDFRLPPQLQFTNLSSGAVIPSSGYTLHWDHAGFASADVVSAYLFAADGTRAIYANCSASAASGELLLPSAILQPFAGKATSFVITLRPRSGSQISFPISSSTGVPVRGFIDYSYIQRTVASVQ